MDLLKLTAVELGDKIQKRELSAIEATEAVLDAIKKQDTQIHAFLAVDEEGALLRAKSVWTRIKAGELTGPLAGVPFAAKDNICTKGIRTTCGSRMLEHYVPTYDATVIEKLEKAGAILIGKTNMDEFAMGSTTETSYFGPTVNPRNVSYVPGGSSGGSAAAVAAREVPFALGSDTGGSIRQPSAFCGVTGFKPTYGTVSRYGLVAYASSLEQVGPIARDVRDCRLIWETIRGADFGEGRVCVKDSTLVNAGGWRNADSNDVFSQSKQMLWQPDNLKGLRVGIPTEYLSDAATGIAIETEIKQAVFFAAKKLEKLGATVQEFSMKLTDKLVPTYYLIACAEASSNLARFDGVKYGYRTKDYKGLTDLYQRTFEEGFGKEVRQRMELGRYVLAQGFYDEYYLKAMKVRSLIKQEYDRAFAQFDVLLTPSTPTAAMPLGQSFGNEENMLAMYLGDVCNVAANLCGLPAISIPGGINSCGLPIGVSLMGNCFGEDILFDVALALERGLKNE